MEFILNYDGATKLESVTLWLIELVASCVIICRECYHYVQERGYYYYYRISIP